MSGNKTAYEITDRQESPALFTRVVEGGDHQGRGNAAPAELRRYLGVSKSSRSAGGSEIQPTHDLIISDSDEAGRFTAYLHVTIVPQSPVIMAELSYGCG